MALAALTTTDTRGLALSGPYSGLGTSAPQKIFLEAAHSISLLLEEVKLDLARFAVQGKDLLLCTPSLEVTLQGYYCNQRPPLLIDLDGNTIDPDGVRALISSVVYVPWGEAALVSKAKLPVSVDDTYLLQQQGHTGLLTANGTVLRVGDQFTTADEIIYYHNEVGMAWDEIPVVTMSGVDTIKLIAAYG